MNRIILFRYHKKPLVCQDRLRQLKNFNPGIKIFGLYGGVESEFPKYKKSLYSYFEHNYCLKDKSDYWKWKNSDLCIRLWYKNIGKDLNFEMLHVIEWDLLLFGSLDKLYQGIPKNGIGLTALNKVSNVIDKWDWLTEEPWKSQWVKLIKYTKDHFNYNQQPYASLGPSSCLPKNFLEQFSSIRVPDLSCDELRLPLFGQIFGYKLYNTKFYKKWFDKNEEKFFNCYETEIDLDLIKNELKRKSGRRVFHPFQKRLKRTIF